jgi:hypothetical protein
VDLPKNRKTLAAGVATAGIVTAALATVVWPALVSPEPPLEKAGDEVLRIRLVEPPKTAIKTAGPLDVGLSEAAQTMAKGREALFDRPAPRPREAPVQIVQADEAEEPSPDPVDDRWEREAARRDRAEQAQRRRWEAEQLAREARAERAAWEQEARDRQRWEEQREPDRYAPPPVEEPGPRPEGW